MGWIGVDLDGTLAHYDGWKGDLEIGAPIQAMVERVRQWLKDGREVKIFTARAFKSKKESDEQWEAKMIVIRRWCETNIGAALDITCIKDQGMEELWDDRCVQVVKNTGMPVNGGQYRP